LFLCSIFREDARQPEEDKTEALAVKVEEKSSEKPAVAATVDENANRTLTAVQSDQVADVVQHADEAQSGESQVPEPTVAGGEVETEGEEHPSVNAIISEVSAFH
jgi:hypothetical protein